MLHLRTMIMKLLISLLESIFSLTLESHLFLDWKFLSLSNYTPRYVHATLQFLDSTGDNSIEWWMLFILFIISTILVSMTT